MRLCKFLKATAGAALASGLAVSLSAVAQPQQNVEWKMQSVYSSSLSVLGPAGVRLTENVERLSNGTFKIQFYEPNALVGILQIFDALKAGSIDAAWTTPFFHSRRIPALVFFSTVPFGPRVGEYLAWMRYGGGDEIYDEIYAEDGLKGFHCGVIAPEGSGWFRDEVRSLDDLRGLKMRFFGLGAKVMKKLGVSTYMLDPLDIYPALEQGVIDATEFSMPSMDVELGFYQIAKHYYFPGWHQQTTVLELLVNRDKFDGLSDHHKAVIEIACSENITWSLVRSEALQFRAMQELQKKGVIIHRWPDSFLQEFERAWQAVIAEEAAADPLWNRVYESYSAFRKDYALWGDHGYLK
jgi:TRAP-type mannitol/chloroaromatic compound transport system substrate-binding protein